MGVIFNKGIIFKKVISVSGFWIYCSVIYHLIMHIMFFVFKRKKVEDKLNKELQEAEAVESRDKIEKLVR